MNISFSKLLFTVTFLLFLQSSTSALGFGEWQFRTNYGSTIENALGNQLSVKGKKLDGLYRWYFYKGKIIGQYRAERDRSERRSLNYFIANERTGEIRTYEEREAWQATLDKENLNPIFARWYSDHFEFAHYFIMLFPLLPIAIIVFVIVGFIALIKEQFDFKKKYTRIFFSVVGLLILISSKNIILGVQSF